MTLKVILKSSYFKCSIHQHHASLINFHLHVLVPNFVFCNISFLNGQLLPQSFRACIVREFSEGKITLHSFFSKISFSLSEVCSQGSMTYFFFSVFIPKKTYIFGSILLLKTSRLGFFFFFRKCGSMVL